MATRIGRDLETRRETRLAENPDGQWTARDLDAEVSAQGATHAETLDAMNAVVDALDSEGGHESTDEELEALGADPNIARTQGDELPDVLV